MSRPVNNPAVFINRYLSEQIQEILPDYFGLPMFFLPSTPTDIQALYEGFPQANEDQPFAVYERMFRMRRSSFPHKKDEQVLYYLYKNGSLNDEQQAAILFETTGLIYDLMDRQDESAEEINSWIATRSERRFYIGNENGYSCSGFPVIDRSDNTVAGCFASVGQAENYLGTLSNPGIVSFELYAIKVDYDNQVKEAEDSGATQQEIDDIEEDRQNEIGRAYSRGIKNFIAPYFHNSSVYQLEEARDVIDFATAKTYFGNKIIINYCYHAPDFNPGVGTRYLNAPEES
jgi:hypothetical protein